MYYSLNSLKGVIAGTSMGVTKGGYGSYVWKKGAP